MDPMKCFKILSVVLGISAFVCIVVALVLPGWSRYEVKEAQKRENETEKRTILKAEFGLFSTRMCTFEYIDAAQEETCVLKSLYAFAEDLPEG